MDEQQRKRFERAVERKQEEARRRGETQAPRGAGADPDGISPDGQMSELIGADRVQDTMGPRDKNSQHRKVSADKWNQ